jgi:hypothetical protein
MRGLWLPSAAFHRFRATTRCPWCTLQFIASRRAVARLLPLSRQAAAISKRTFRWVRQVSITCIRSRGRRLTGEM